MIFRIVFLCLLIRFWIYLDSDLRSVKSARSAKKQRTTLKIPIYSRFKNYLESKGLDSATSGQIVWFVFSVVIAHILFAIAFSENILGLVFPAHLYNNFIKLFFFLFIFCLNIFYKHNFIPMSILILSALTARIHIVAPFILLVLSIIITYTFFKKTYIKTYLFWILYFCIFALLCEYAGSASK